MIINSPHLSRASVETAPSQYAKDKHSRYVEDLETTFQAALAAENFNAAIKAKQLLGQNSGFLPSSNKTPLKHSLSLANMSDEELENLLNSLKN